MNDEGSEQSKEQLFEDWDEDFLNTLLVQEQLVLTASSSSSSKENSGSFPNSNPVPEPQPSASFLPFENHHHRSTNVTHSPPRELSQRPIDVDTYQLDRLPMPHGHGVSASVHSLDFPHDDVKDREIQRLKRELEHASKQLSTLERECCELRNKRNKKEEQIKCASLGPVKMDVDDHSLKDTNLRHARAPKNHRSRSALDNEIEPQNHLGGVRSSSKAIGIQTDKTDESSKLGSNRNFSSHANVSNKLRGIWGCASDQKSGRDLIPELFTACPEDFRFLLGCFSVKISEMSRDSLNGKGSSNVALQGQRHSFCPSEAAKVSHLYSVLTEIGDGLLQLESLIGPLVDLCHLNNVDILRCSLTILHVFLKHFFSAGRKLEERDSVKIEGAISHNTCEDRILSSVTAEASCARNQLVGIKSSFHPPTFSTNGISKLGTGLPTCVDWVSLFDFLNSVATSKAEGRARLEAVSSMNLILLRTNALEEREMFGQAPIFESISRFLRKEAGSDVRKEALQLLFLLLNSPRLLTNFCSGCKDENDAENDENKASSSKGYGAILEGVAGCIGSRENNLQGAELRKRAVVIVAFLAASGKSGFELLLNHKLCGGKSFLLLILQLLMSEMDVEVSTSLEPPECIKARTLLMREALILLNRIVSNQWYSGIVLRILTESREMSYMTMDIVTRLSQDVSVRRQPTDSITRRMREMEIVDLAKQLKKRVYAYLGDRIA